MSTAGYLIDDRFRLHDPGSLHPESPSRLAHIQQVLDESGIAQRWPRIEARPATEEQLTWVHTRGHIENVRQASLNAPRYLDADTPVCAASYDTALLAAGSVPACAAATLDGTIARSFAFVRPPGHHAERDRAMGFCLFNNIAVGAAYLKSVRKLERIAIVDFDIHHGNGTQACFYSDPQVLYISTHQYPFYPGTGRFGEIGLLEGWGYNINMPLPAGAGDAVFVPIYREIVAAILDQYRPQFILVSAGFDALAGDPIGGLTVSVAGFASAAASLCRAADRNCEGRICFLLEGGYGPAGLQACTRAVLAELESDHPAELQLPGDDLYESLSDYARGEFGEIWNW